MKTGLVVYRCIRGTSALEGYHLHLRASRDPRARTASPRLQHAGSMWFDWRWNVLATIEAGLMPAIGHEYLWLRDMLVDILRDTPLGHGVNQIEEIAGWNRIDTTRQPTMPRGLRSVPLRDSPAAPPAPGAIMAPPPPPAAPRRPSVASGRHRNRSLAPHSKMNASDWFQIARNHLAPSSAHDHPAEALSNISALIKGDSSVFLASKGINLPANELTAFASMVKSRVRTNDLLRSADHAGLRSSLQMGTSASVAPLLVSQTALSRRRCSTVWARPQSSHLRPRGLLRRQ